MMQVIAKSEPNSTLQCSNYYCDTQQRGKTGQYQQAMCKVEEESGNLCNNTMPRQSDIRYDNLEMSTRYGIDNTNLTSLIKTGDSNSSIC